jgi:hypothetical protein
MTPDTIVRGIAELEFVSKTTETEKSLHERAEAIAIREQEFNLLHTKVAKFEDDLAKAVNDGNSVRSLIRWGISEVKLDGRLS